MGQRADLGGQCLDALDPTGADQHSPAVAGERPGGGRADARAGTGHDGDARHPRSSHARTVDRHADALAFLRLWRLWLLVALWLL
jgi:hypothetical protein